MAFNVRVFGFRGYQQVPIHNPQQPNADTPVALEQPPEWGEVKSVSAVPVSTTPQPAPDYTRVLVVEIPDGSEIGYEVNPPNRPGGVVAAAAKSPRATLRLEVPFFQGWSLSMIDAAGL